jgi:hypothetical protein
MPIDGHPVSPGSALRAFLGVFGRCPSMGIPFRRVDMARTA